MNIELPGLIRALTLTVHQDLVDRTPFLFKSSDVKRDRKFLSTCPLEVVLRDLPMLGKSLDICLATGSGFETLVYPNSINKRFLSYWLNGSPDSDKVLAARQLLKLFSKLEPCRGVDFVGASDTEAFNDFVIRNAALPPIQRRTPLLYNGRLFLAKLLGNVDLASILPKHGPGAVATGEKAHSKMNFKRIYKSMDTLYPVDEYFFLNSSHLCDDLLHLRNMQVLDEPCAKLVAVPKDFRGPRLISMEPLEVQWIQQGQARVLMQHLETHSLSRGHVNFTSQEVNRMLAMHASISGDYVTIDMKDASDRVSYTLVKELFPSTVFQYLDASRSTHTMMPNGTRVRLNMFAPMGSAVCFPIESVVFFALAVAAIRMKTNWNIERCTRCVYVYGDDLIIKSEFSDLVIAALESVHLAVNREKSCVGPSFRESCGNDCYEGVCVTPIRIKKLPDHRALTSRLAAVDYINNFTAAYFEKTAALLKKATEQVFGIIPYSTLDVPGTIRCASVQECVQHNAQHFKSRYLSKYQHMEFRIPYLVPHRTKTQNKQHWSETFQAICLGSSPCRQGYAVPHRVRLIQRWTQLN